MWLSIIAVIGGLVILLGSGELLVRGAVGLANRLNVPTLLIGLTIVAFGTSAPELVVSIQAVLAGENGIAIGNIVGSNIANVFLVLGVPALLTAICTASAGLRRHAVVMLLATGFIAYIVYGRAVLDGPVGLALLTGIIVYVFYIGMSAMRRASSPEAAELMEEVNELACETSSLPKVLLLLIIGLVGLPIGGTLLVTYGAELAAELGVREEIIGLTLVAFGTSLPELATVWAAAKKGHADVAVGNIVGSNIFNILFVGGAAGLVGTTQFSDPDLPGYSDVATTIDVPLMIVAALLLAGFIFAKGKITRFIGLLFCAGYIGYIAYLGLSAGL